MIGLWNHKDPEDQLVRLLCCCRCAGINLLDLAVAAVLPAVLLFLLAWTTKQVWQWPAALVSQTDFGAAPDRHAPHRTDQRPRAARPVCRCSVMGGGDW